jgi:hypothetical protein
MLARLLKEKNDCMKNLDPMKFLMRATHTSWIYTVLAKA